MHCWNCKTDLSHQSSLGFFACPKCSAPDFIGTDRSPFAVLGAPRQYDLDLSELEERYLALSKWLHPDRYATLGNTWTKKCGELSALVNESYESLKNSESRLDGLLVGSSDLAKTNSDAIPTRYAERFFEMQELRMEDAAAARALALSLQSEIKQEDNALLEQIDRIARSLNWNKPLEKQSLLTLMETRAKRAYLRSLIANLQKVLL